MVPTESLTNREWLPGELLNGSECRRPGWFLDMKYQTCFGKNGPFLENWSESCKSGSGTFNTCKEVFSLSTAPTVPHVLVPVWSLSLTGWELLSWDSAGASAPIKAHARYVCTGNHMDSSAIWE